MYIVYFHGLWIVSALLLLLTYTIYQPSIGLFTAMVFVLTIQPIWSDKKIMEVIRNNFGFLISSCKSLLCGSLLYLPIYLYMSSFATDGYTAQQNARVTSVREIAENVYIILKTSLGKLIGRPHFHEDMGVIFFAVVLLSIAVILVNNSVKNSVIKLVICLPLLLLAILACFPVYVFLSNQYLFPRVSIALAVVVVALYSIPLLQRKFALIRNISFFIALITIYSFLQFHNVNSFSQQMTNLHNFSLAIRIADRIETSPQYSSKKRYRIFSSGNAYRAVAAAGSRAYATPIVTNVYGRAFNWYVSNHFKMIGLANVSYDWNGKKHHELSEDIIDKMPSWPAEGSIQFLPKDRIVIKF